MTSRELVTSEPGCDRGKTRTKHTATRNIACKLATSDFAKASPVLLRSSSYANRSARRSPRAHDREERRDLSAPAFMSRKYAAYVHVQVSSQKQEPPSSITFAAALAPHQTSLPSSAPTPGAPTLVSHSIFAHRLEFVIIFSTTIFIASATATRILAVATSIGSTTCP